MSNSAQTDNPWRWHASPHFFILGAIALQLCSWQPLFAQQRDPAVEIYALTGTYYFGYSPNLLKNEEWRPQVGVGVLFPLGSRWALMIDGATSHLEVAEGPHGPGTFHPYSEFYRLNPGIPNEDVTTQRLIAVRPSIVRMWRRDRFSIYVGGGLGWERQNQLIRYRQIDAEDHPDGGYSNFSRAEEFVDSKDNVSVFPLIFRTGVLLNLAPRVVLRGGYSHIIGYLDTPASRSLEVGIGYRF